MFKYRVVNPGAPEYVNGPSLQRIGSQEVLLGNIGGQKASDLEERFAKSLQKLSIPFDFRVRISSLVQGQRRLTTARANLPGELEIDFLTDFGQIIPILIDGEISHFATPYQAEQDREKESLIDNFGEDMNWHPVIRVPFTEMQTQEEVDGIVRRIINGSYVAQFVA